MNLLHVIGIIFFIIVVLYILIYTNILTDTIHIIIDFIDYKWLTSKPKLIEHKIIIKDMKFTPDYLEINEGDTVVFISEEFSHNIMFIGKDNEKYNHPDILEVEEKHIVIFEKKGKYEYFCQPHPSMTGIIIVE
jgi:plastocyanin